MSNRFLLLIASIKNRSSPIISSTRSFFFVTGLCFARDVSDTVSPALPLMLFYQFRLRPKFHSYTALHRFLTRKSWSLLLMRDFNSQVSAYDFIFENSSTLDLSNMIRGEHWINFIYYILWLSGTPINTYKYLRL